MTTMTLHITNSGIIDKIQRFVAELSGVEITEIKETNSVCEGLFIIFSCHVGCFISR